MFFLVDFVDFVEKLPTKGKRKIFSFGQQYPLLSFVEDVVDL
ncbi:hypothetical protein BOVA514_3262 [Bacteroides ovatus]|nr:hypothetical protein BOVA514_3262 [Bacteroides ovatus]